MMIIFWALLLRVAAAQPSVGVCIVLTNVDHTKHESFAELSSLLASLAGQDVRRCLVSDLKTHKGTVAEKLLKHDAKAVIDDWYSTKSVKELAALEPALMGQWNGTHGQHVVSHRLARIISYETPPYDVTLYLDDDTYICPDGASLGSQLLDLARNSSVRLAERWLAQGEAHVSDWRSRAVARGLLNGEAHLTRPFDLQGGAILLTKSEPQRAWARALREAYVGLWSSGIGHKRGRDQPALDLAAARVAVRALPVAFNFKVAPWCDRDAHDGTRCRRGVLSPRLCEHTPRRQIGAVHLVTGAVRVVHQKGLEDPTGLCRAVNSIESARAVTGADKCGLHGLRIRVEAIEAGSPWLAPTRGFVLAATRDPVQALLTEDSELGALLHDVCATGYPCRVVVADESELEVVEERRPCSHIEPWVLPSEWIPRTPPHPAARNGSHENHQRVRFHKVAALAANAELYEGGTIYIDNDISLKRSHMKELFAVFDGFGNKSIGFNKDWTNRANPVHQIEGIPKGFPERNGGVCFMRGAGASIITRDWLNELASNPGPGGTDQMPLRRVLWRHREHLYDLPSHVQCRCRKESICENGALLWHLHRIYRLDVLRRAGNASVSMCGFVP